MTQDTQPEPARAAPDDRDFILGMLVNHANRGQIEVGVTLSVGGILVSGQIVSGRRFFQRLGEVFDKAAGSDDGALAKQLAEGWDATVPPESPDDDDPRRDPYYIHLDRAQFFLPTGETPIPADGQNLWRGKLSAVDGWNLGTLGPAPSTF